MGMPLIYPFLSWQERCSDSALTERNTDSTLNSTHTHTYTYTHRALPLGWQERTTYSTELHSHLHVHSPRPPPSAGSRHTPSRSPAPW